MTPPIAIIPCRAGSRRIPGKNKRLLGGKPLWQWSAERARQAGCTVVVATDDHDIEVGAFNAGYWPIALPSELCMDTSPVVDAVGWALRRFRDQHWGLWNGHNLLLQPTSPFRRVDDIRSAKALLQKCSGVVGVVKDPGAYFRWGEDGPLYEGRPRTQEIRLWRETGALYAFWWAQVWVTKRLFGPSARRLEMPWWAALDINTEEDWEQAELLLSRCPEVSPWHRSAESMVKHLVAASPSMHTGFATELHKAMQESCASTGHYRMTRVSDDGSEVSDIEWADKEIASLRHRLDEVTRERDALRRGEA